MYNILHLPSKREVTAMVKKQIKLHVYYLPDIEEDDGSHAQFRCLEHIHNAVGVNRGFRCSDCLGLTLYK